MRYNPNDITTHPAYYSGIDAEGYTFEQRMRKRSSNEVAGYRPRPRRKKFCNQFDDAVVPGSVQTSRDVGLV